MQCICKRQYKVLVWDYKFSFCIIILVSKKNTNMVKMLFKYLQINVVIHKLSSLHTKISNEQVKNVVSTHMLLYRDVINVFVIPL